MATASYYLPQGKSLWIPAGVTRYLGTTEYVTTSTALTLSAWQQSNWVNYTVTASGTQTICANASNKPTYVAINGAEASEGSGWSWSGGVTTLSTASSAAISWTYASVPPIVIDEGPYRIVPNAGQVTFIALLQNRPADGAEITLYQLPYSYYYKTLWTDGEGKAYITLPWGNYNFSAEYKADNKEYRAYDTIYHTTSEIVTIEFDTGKVSSQPAFSISGWYVKVGLLAFIVCVAVVVIVSFGKRR